MPPASAVAHSLTILLAEDNPINRMIIKVGLERLHHRVTAVENGAEALELASRHRFDLILMDIQMPVMDGTEATRRIRLLPPPHAQIPIVALTADALPEHRAAALKAGLTAILTKPIDWHEVEIVLAGLSPSDSAAPRPKPAAPLPETAPLAAVPGLEVGQALIRLGGDVAMLGEMLGRLADGTVGQAAALGDLLAADDRAEAARRMHSLRGSAGNLGVTGLAALAGRIESAILAARMTELPDLLHELAITTTAFRQGVEAMKALQTQPDSAAVLDFAELAQMIILLREGNLAALDSYKILAAALKGALPGAAHDVLTAAMVALDFPRALEVLERIDEPRTLERG